jgi:hypothetical protein
VAEDWNISPFRVDKFGAKVLWNALKIKVAFERPISGANEPHHHYQLDNPADFRLTLRPSPPGRAS